jgi:hypothetical protein
MSSKYRQGVFTPINKEKFIGSTAIYRSGLELKYFRFFDNNKNVVKWSSESIVIPYISPVDGKVHRYFVDNMVYIREGNTIKKYLIEIKPYKQTLPPTTNYKKKQHLLYEQQNYFVNQAKWQAAREFCKRKGLEFIILTEREIK